MIKDHDTLHEEQRKINQKYLDQFFMKLKEKDLSYKKIKKTYIKY